MNINNLEKIISTNIGNYIILPELSCQDYLNLGLVNKNMYNLLKINKYAQILNAAKFCASFTHNLTNLTMKELDNIQINDVTSTEHNIIKHHSLMPLKLLSINSKLGNLKYYKKWVVIHNNFFKLYHMSSNGKIIMSYMIPLFGTATNYGFDNVIQTFKNCVSCGIGSPYKYLMVAKCARKNTLFAIFNKSHIKLIIECLLEYNNKNNIVEHIIKALYGFINKLSCKISDDKLDRIGDYIYVSSDYIGCTVKENYVDIFLVKYNVVSMPCSTNYTDFDYVRCHWNKLKKEIIKSLTRKLDEPKINLLMKEFNKY